MEYATSKQHRSTRQHQIIPFICIILASLAYLRIQYPWSSDKLVTSLPQNYASLRAHCASLDLKPTLPASFPDRPLSDRFVPGTRPVHIRNATIWTGSDNGREVIEGDLVLDNGLIKAVGVIPKVLLKELKRTDHDIIHAHGAWLTPG